jgi:hypothetical protein
MVELLDVPTAVDANRLSGHEVRLHQEEDGTRDFMLATPST